MNWFILIAGLGAAFTTIGHFTMGSKMYLKPMLEADFDPVAKKVMHAVFHYVSAFLILSAAALLGVAFGLLNPAASQLLVLFIAASYAFFAVWQIILVLTSGIEKGLFKMFQWVFFVVIAVFAHLGS